MTDVDRLTAELIKAGADRAKVIAIVDGYGDAVDWSHYSLDSIVSEVWQSDLNSGDEPDGWIINEICRNFNVPEVSEWILTSHFTNTSSLYSGLMADYHKHAPRSPSTILTTFCHTLLVMRSGPSTRSDGLK